MTRATNILNKVIVEDATQVEVDAGTVTNKYVSPKTLTDFSGLVEDATQAEVDAGTVTNKYVSPSTLASYSGLATEGTAVKSTGEAGGTKFLREDGDGTSSWQSPVTFSNGLSESSGVAGLGGTLPDNSLILITHDGGNTAHKSQIDIYRDGDSATAFDSYVHIKSTAGSVTKYSEMGVDASFGTPTVYLKVSSDDQDPYLSLSASGVTINLGSDATGDIYYRNASGVFTRLAVGSTNQQLTINASGLPVWQNDTPTVALVDGATIDLTGSKHTLATALGRTFTNSFTGDFIEIDITLSATSATFTFPVGYLCSFAGTASGDNTLVITGATSGDIISVAIKKNGSQYLVAAANFGQ
jgi:hypothetical protein